ncbi:MAG: DUF4279 domain-containing protein [Oscillospiraceae bacterium]|nr:DUF4279 domain-containing protein [Oscillospiraceae bacterium]
MEYPENMQRVYYHAEETQCMTYFRIVGDFDPDLITRYLRLVPEQVHRIGEARPNGTTYTEASWRFGTVKSHRLDTANQMMQTIEPLLTKADLLRKIKLTYDAKLWLQVVPLVRWDEPAPMLAPSLAVMRFCVETGTEIDVDLYVGCPDDMVNNAQ